MGSIVAILARTIPIDMTIARRMLAAAPHRGSEFAVTLCGRCVLGASYKAESVDSTISSGGRLMAAFAGKLDNAEDLTTLLTRTGQAPKSGNPADIVVSLFEAFGADAPNRMRGVFSGIVTDGRQVWCFRDHLGFKPLYYRDEPRAFFVATEVKQIITGAELKRIPNPDAIEHLLFGSGTTDKPCALLGANHIRQAITYTASVNTTIQSYRYWNPEKLLETARLSPAEIAERFSELFDQAVNRCLTGEDVISLSGGIDSSAIAAFAAPQYLNKTGRPLSALSAVFPNLPKVDESRYIQMTVDALGMQLHTYEIKAPTLEDAPRWCEILDGPVYSMAIPDLYENYTLAHQLGYRNIITGDIAEYVVGFRSHIIGHLLTHGRWTALSRLIATEVLRGRSRRGLVREVVNSLIPGQITNWYLRKRGPDPRKWIPDWVDHAKVRQRPYRPDLMPPARKRWSTQEIVAFKGTTLLDEALDVCSDLCGVTVRRPFADIDLWEFFLSLPAEIKVPDLRLKTFLRGLLRGKVPDAILDRRDKTVFNDHIMARIDYSSLRKYLLNSSFKVQGINYQRLAARIERNEVNMFDWMMANALVRVHAFLSLT
jgi:asparagine synthase (glutamine-hydrolysing)